MKIIKLLLLLTPICSLFAKETGSDYPYKKLLAEAMELESYYVKADQSSEIAQTRYHRGLYIMSELSALRAKTQFEKADESIDFYISKVAGSNLRGVMPWNRTKYKKSLTDKALELRLLLATQEEDLKALIQEIENQLAKMDRVSVSETLEKLQDLIEALEQKLPHATPEEKPAIVEALRLLKGTRENILAGIENEDDVTDMVGDAASMVEDLLQSGLVGDVLKQSDQVNTNTSFRPENNKSSRIPAAKVETLSAGSEVGSNRSSNSNSLSNGIPNSDLNRHQGKALADQFSAKLRSSLQPTTNDIRYIGQNSGGDSFVQLPDGRKIRVSRPPQDWPNGKATGYESIYDDRSGGNLIKEEEIVFERIAGDNGYQIKQLENSKTSRKWNFRIKESGGFDDRYSLTSLGNEVDFEVTSWVLRDSSRNVIERLDGNNLHFDPSELSEGDYSIEVAGITGWNSPFTVGASVLR